MHIIPGGATNRVSGIFVIDYMQQRHTLVARVVRGLLVWQFVAKSFGVVQK